MKNSIDFVKENGKHRFSNASGDCMNTYTTDIFKVKRNLYLIYEAFFTDDEPYIEFRKISKKEFNYYNKNLTNELV